MAIALAAFTVAVHIWLYPVHRAWALSSDGFTQLRQDNVAGFVEKLTQAHQLAPWEPYYSYQLGWNLGDLSFQASDPAQQQQLRQDAIAWFQSANEVSPYQEFGHSNLGWLAVNAGDIDMAVESFSRSAQLVPAKKGVFFGLGFSLMQQGKPELAAQAIALELVRQPLLISSPVWRIGPLAAIADQIIEQTLKTYDQLEAVAQSDTALSSYIHQNRGALHWWLGDITKAEADWTSIAKPLGSVLLQLSQSADSAALRETVEALPETSAKYALLAWLTPSNRHALLEKAWANLPLEDLSTVEDVAPPAEIIDSLLQAMSTSNHLDEWLKEPPITWQPRSQRSGFGVLSRHIDGPLPKDYLPRIENLVVTRFFEDVFDMSAYLPRLDQQINSQRIEFPPLTGR
ncbi:MAG: polymerase, partial [Cyanobacteria bacterium P01_H01_bin.119]